MWSVWDNLDPNHKPGLGGAGRQLVWRSCGCPLMSSHLFFELCQRCPFEQQGTVTVHGGDTVLGVLRAARNPIPSLQSPVGHHGGLQMAPGVLADPAPSSATPGHPHAPVSLKPLGCKIFFLFCCFHVVFLSLCHFTSSYVFLHFHTVVMGRSEVGSCQNLLIPCAASFK